MTLNAESAICGRLPIRHGVIGIQTQCAAIIVAFIAVLTTIERGRDSIDS